MNWRDLDEDDVRVRPNPKGSRPRTKIRPSFENAEQGMVLEVHLARYRVLTESGVEVLATLAKELRQEGCVTCDQVLLDGDVSGKTGTLARIVQIQPRSSELTRVADDGSEQRIVANADQLVIVMAATNPEPRARLVDRFLVASYVQGLDPVLVMTKCDLADPKDFIENFSDTNLKIIKTSKVSPNLAELRSLIAGKKSVFVGHSGVGKSTLINQLAPESARVTGEVNEATGKGKHTSSSAVAIDIGEGWIIDTPGVRTFGLSGITTEQILSGFSDLNEVAKDCPRDCSHLAGSPDCELDAAVTAGNLKPERVSSFRRLADSISSVDWQ
ncbi:MAG: ribosome small subunit-dependent GTPase [Actinomycetota bacterium]